MKLNKKKVKKIKEKPKQMLTRKELRKQKLQQKKENKRIFFSSKYQDKQEFAAVNETTLKDAKTNRKTKRINKTKNKKNGHSDIAVEKLLSNKVHYDDDESIASDFSDPEIDMKMPAKKPKTVVVAPMGVRKSKMAARPDITELHQRELQREKKLAKEAKRHRIKQLRVENDEEDKIIHSLEKKLKLNRTKDKNRLVRKMFSADGLDWALEFCLDDNAEQKKREAKEKRMQLKNDQDHNLESWDEEDENDEMQQADSYSDRNSNIEEDEDDNDAAASDDEDAKIDHEQKQEYLEDIYGRKRDRHGNIIKENEATNTSHITTKYIPPHQRDQQLNKSEAEDEKQKHKLERLKKNCKGLLNRLSEANLHKIASSIEELYAQNARYYMNDTLCALLNEALITRTLCNERMLQEHMVLLSYLHAHIGTEIGAHFLQYYMQQFDNYIKNLSTLAIDDKQLNNIVLVLCYIYMFRIYDHRLLLEIIEHLMQHLCEKSVECLLLIFQSVGMKLRKDDPLAFKQMLLNVQQRIAKTPLELQQNLRLKFMTDVLHALKNNNLHKLPQMDPHLPEQLRKRLKGMLRTDKYVTTLNIAMTDLLRANQVGKWWVVGSAWTGNINDTQNETATNKEEGEQEQKSQRYSDKLTALARAHHMNTEERRLIFCIILSAEDYVDAFEKILHLSLKDQRAIAYVVLHCCMQERQFNPYYAHLAHKFCQYNRKFQLAFQFASWDRIHNIDELSKMQIRNMAKLLLQLIARGSLSLSVLKVVNFVQLHKPSFLFIKEIMLGLLLWKNGEHDVNETQIDEAFERVAKNPKLKLFKNSLRIFLQYFLLQRSNDSEAFVDARVGSVDLKLNDEQQALLKDRGDKIDNILAYIDF